MPMHLTVHTYKSHDKFEQLERLCVNERKGCAYDHACLCIHVCL